MKEEKKWFAKWFNTKYYHILYQNRDYNEAEIFIENLFGFLNVRKESSVLDAACGSGRHSVMVHNLGYKVHGIDLSSESITTAKSSEKEGLSFGVSDLREFNEPLEFDLVLNLFTSFGYFENLDDNLKVLTNFKDSIKAGGMLVLDFMNAHKVKLNLVSEESKLLDEIEFKINRVIENNIIVKNINFVDYDGNTQNFQERVSGFELEDFERLFGQAGFKICHIFGDYFLNNFDRKESPRLILIAKPV